MENIRLSTLIQILVAIVKYTKNYLNIILKVGLGVKIFQKCENKKPKVLKDSLLNLS